MITVESTTVNENTTLEEFQNSWVFSIENGNTGEKTIIDPLLDTHDRALVRAKSEFLQNSYSLKSASFQTYRTDIGLNACLTLEGLKYIVKNLETKITHTTMITTVQGVRYE